MSLEKIIAEALAGRPLEMKEAFKEEIQSRIQFALEERYVEMVESDDEHPHEKAMDDHTSQAHEHDDNSDHPEAGKHHQAAADAHHMAAHHLEYGRVKQAKKSAEKAVEHAKKAKALGGADHVAETDRILKTHH